jgi:DNA-binding response OmpR family regulator
VYRETASGMTSELHVLMVDDEFDLLEIVASLLETEGFQVSVYDDPRSAVAAVCDGLTPDLVMLDFRMPWLNGSETLKQMRGCGLTAPAVLVSAMASLAAESAAAGFDDALSKPFEIDELARLLRRLPSVTRAPGPGMA